MKRVSKESNNNGRAYEYICLMTLFNDISKNCKARIIENSSFASSKKAWNNIEKNMQNLLEISAKTASKKLFELEPIILDDSNADDILGLKIQSDENGIIGDVRDIIIFRDRIG